MVRKPRTSIKNAARRIRTEWPVPAEHRVPDPDRMLCAAILLNAHDNLAAGDDAAQKLREAHRQAADALRSLKAAIQNARRKFIDAEGTIRWLRNQRQMRMPLHLVSEYAGYSEAQIMAVVLKTIDPKLYDFIAKAPGGECPLCLKPNGSA